MHIARNTAVARKVRGLAAGLAPLCALGTAVCPAVADEPQQVPGITVAIIDLAEAPGLAPAPRAEARRASSWRTSFGSERQTETKPKARADASLLDALADADVVLIQGVHAAAPLRRLFPPRAWRLVVSRRIIAPAATMAVAGAAPDRIGASSASATAIAVRASPDIRVTAREPGLRLVAPEPGSAAAAATAVRVATRGRVLWLASVALPPSCAGKAACPAETALGAWRTSKRGYGETTLVGGRLTASSEPRADKSGTAVACLANRIESDLDSKPVPPAGHALPKEGSGCISIVRLDGVPGISQPQPLAAEAEAVAKSPDAP